MPQPVYKILPRGTLKLRKPKKTISPFLIKRYILNKNSLSPLDIALLEKGIDRDPVAQRTLKEFQEEYG